MAEVHDIFVSTEPFMQERRIEIISREPKNGWDAKFDKDAASKFVYGYKVIGSDKNGAAPRISYINDSGLSKHYKKEEKDG